MSVKRVQWAGTDKGGTAGPCSAGLFRAPGAFVPPYGEVGVTVGLLFRPQFLLLSLSSVSGRGPAVLPLLFFRDVGKVLTKPQASAHPVSGSFSAVLVGFSAFFAFFLGWIGRSVATFQAEIPSNPGDSTWIVYVLIALVQSNRIHVTAAILVSAVHVLAAQINFRINMANSDISQDMDEVGYLFISSGNF